MPDDLYPDWLLLAMPALQTHTSTKKSNYTKKEEGCRKDVASCFGVLQARFEIDCRNSQCSIKLDVCPIRKVCDGLPSIFLKVLKCVVIKNPANEIYLCGTTEIKKEQRWV